MAIFPELDIHGRLPERRRCSNVRQSFSIRGDLPPRSTEMKTCLKLELANEAMSVWEWGI